MTMYETMSRGQRAKLGAATLGIIEQRGYTNTAGRWMNLAPAITTGIDGTMLYRPEQLAALVERLSVDAPDSRRPLVEVTDETTLCAAHRLWLDGTKDVLALNFASAKNPGGGFLSGSRAQEESLARASALYASLTSAQAYYDANRATRTPVYTDHTIYSPRVPVFRSDDGALLDEPYPVSFVTAPAVNVSALRQHNRHDQAVVERTMARRVPNVLAVAAEHGHRALVLGAWGCGVFGNDPALIARLFSQALEGPLGNHFSRVVFAVFDPSPDRGTFGAFRRQFEHPTR